MGNCVCESKTGEDQISVLKLELDQVSRECNELQQKCGRLEVSHRNLEWQHQRQVLRNRELEIIFTEESKDASEAASGAVLANSAAQAEMQSLREEMRQLQEQLVSQRLAQDSVTDNGCSTEDPAESNTEFEASEHSGHQLAAALKDHRAQFLRSTQLKISGLQDQLNDTLSRHTTSDVESLEAENAALLSEMAQKNKRIEHTEAALQKVQEEMSKMTAAIQDSKEIEIVRLRAENRKLSVKNEELQALELGHPCRHQQQDLDNWLVDGACEEPETVHCSRTPASTNFHDGYSQLTPSRPTRTSLARPPSLQSGHADLLHSRKSLTSASTESRPSVASSSSSSPQHMHNKVLTNFVDRSFGRAPLTPKSKSASGSEGYHSNVMLSLLSRESTCTGDRPVQTASPRSVPHSETHFRVQNVVPGVHLLSLSRVRQVPLGTKASFTRCPSAPLIEKTSVQNSPRCTTSPAQAARTLPSERRAASYSFSPSCHKRSSSHPFAPSTVQRNSAPTSTTMHTPPACTL